MKKTAPKLRKNKQASLPTKFRWVVLRISRHIWVRATAYSLVGIILAMLALWTQDFFPKDFALKIDGDAVDSLLTIIATSMLSVIIFSLSTIVAAFNLETSNATPRATVLLAEDATAQNVLSVFLGAFIYSLAALILLKLGNYGNNGRVVLYFITIFMIATIVITLVKWIDYTMKLGRVSSTTDRVQFVATQAMEERVKSPLMSGGYWSGKPADIPPATSAVYPHGFNYVQHIDVNDLQSIAETSGLQVYINRLPGEVVHNAIPVAYVSIPAAHETERESIMKSVLGAFSLGDERTFDHDPRFGVCALSEIASKALSPAINDPGTAIDVITNLAEVLTKGKNIFTLDYKSVTPTCKNVFVPPLSASSLFDDAFNSIARDGASLIEVNIQLQKTLAYLASLGVEEYKACACYYAQIVLQRALKAIDDESDQQRARHAAEPLLKGQKINRLGERS